MGNGIGKVQPAITAGGGILANEGTTYGVGTLGTSVTIPIGKRTTLTPEVSALAGKDVKGLNGSLNLTIQNKSNPKLSMNVGLGFENRKYNGTNFHDEYTIVDQQTTPMNGEDELMQTGDFHEQTDVTIDKEPKQRRTTGYLSLGAKYQANKNLSFNGGLKLGLTDLKGPYSKEVRITDGEYVTEGAIHVYEVPPEEFQEMGFLPFDYWSGKVDKEQRHTEQIFETTVKGPVPTGAISGGAEYQINNKLAVGVQGQVGIGEWSESFVGAHLKVKL